MVNVICNEGLVVIKARNVGGYDETLHVAKEGDVGGHGAEGFFARKITEFKYAPDGATFEVQAVSRSRSGADVITSLRFADSVSEVLRGFALAGFKQPEVKPQDPVSALINRVQLALRS